MKKIISCYLFILIISLDSKAQYVQLPDINNQDTIINCNYDSTETITAIKKWEIYHTINDVWDGEIDSSYCINTFTNGYNISILASEIDVNKPFFIRATLDDTTKTALQKNSLYNLKDPYINTFNKNYKVDTSKTCNGDYCSKTIINISIPDTSYTSLDIREYTKPYDQTNYMGYCIPIEKFENQFL